jgi:15-cis-phytoene synthase
MIGLDEQLALAYAPASLRPNFAVLFEFDAALGQAFKATRTIDLTQIRLVWWRDQLDRDNSNDPLATAIRSLADRYDVSVDMLKMIIEGWAVLLDDLPYSETQLENYARLRGGTLFAVAARMADGLADERAGMGWAMTDFARHCSHPETADRAMALARTCLRDNVAATLPKPMQTFAILTRFAQADSLRALDQQRPAGSPYRIIQAIGFTLFKR